MRKRQQREPASIKQSEEQSSEKKPTLKFVPLGGFEEIGRNMMFFEYENEILVIDAGLQFPEENTPGIDYIIPNISYLEEHKDKIVGFIITHGHYDHIGAIPHVLGKMGNPTIITNQISKEIINKRQQDYPGTVEPRFDIVKGGSTRKIGKHFSVEFFDVIHNIPDGVGIIIETPIGKIVHPGEFKFDYDKEGKAVGMDTWKKLGKQNIHTLLLDSTGAEVPGVSIAEHVVEGEIEKLIKSTRGRVIVATFASLLDRLAAIMKIAEKYNRHVAVSGYSMKTNLQIARDLKYIKLRNDTLIPIQEINKYPDNKVLLLCTGAQGEPNASLMRIANKMHKQVTLKPTDMIILSSSIVPGNEHSVQVIKDNLARQTPNIYHNKMLDIHSSGHAPMEELKAVIGMVKPRFFMPMHGYYFMRMRNAKHAQEVLGLSHSETIVGDNGQVVEMTKDSIRLTDKEIPSSYVMVDGLGVGDVEEVVLRDRRNLSEEGMVVIITTIGRHHKKMIKNPDIISRGFIYLKKNQELLENMRKKIRSIVARFPRDREIESEYLKTLIRDQIGQFIYTKTKRRPMILPVVIEI